MKKSLLLFASLLLVFLLLNSSCKKEGNDDGFSNSEGCSASWKVDGVDYSETDMAGCVFLDSTLNISTNLTGGNFFLQIDPIISTGTYVADATNQDLSVVLFMDLLDGTSIGIKDGSVVMTELSNSKAKGTFSGNFFDIIDLTFDPKYSVTNGEFEVDF